MDPNVPGSSNPDPTSGDPFGRNDDGTVKNPQPAQKEHVESVKTTTGPATPATPEPAK
jgi:hypothetical protein